MFNTKEELSTYIIDGAEKDSLFLVKILRSHSQNDKIRNILKLEKDEKASEAIYKLLHNVETPLCECGKPKKFINVVKGYHNFCATRNCKYRIDRMMEITHDTHMKLHGCHPMSTKETQDNYRKTMIERYGTINTVEVAKRNGTYISAWEKDEIKQKIKNTFNKKYGGHPMQNDEPFLNNLRSRVKFKNFELPSGKIIKLQGYEDRGLKILLENHSEEDILTNIKDIHNYIGIIRYSMDGKEHKYYPDFYVISTNTIFEVKSGWTYNANKKKNELKKQKCLELGFNFEFMLF